jgi:hypothetical protein
MHRHKYTEIERFYAPAIKMEGFEGNMSAKAMKKFLSGVTTIRFECSICGKQWFKEVLGKENGKTM